MKVKISEEAILKALDNTDRDFDIKVFYKVLDKMPTIYYKQMILDEFFAHLCGVPFYEIYDTVTGSREYFFTKVAMAKYASEKKIASKDFVLEAIKKGKLVKKRYLFRGFVSSDNYEAPDVTSSDAYSILDCSIYRAKAIDDT